MLKNLNLTVLLSLAGVVVGWLLSEASSLLKGRREHRRIFGRAVLRLLQLREMVEGEIKRAELAKGLTDAGKLDKEQRARLASERNRELIEFLETSNEALVEISTIDPFFSYELDRHMRGMTNVLTISGTYASKPLEDELNQFWDGALIGSEGHVLKFLIAADVDRLISKVARRKGLASWVKAKVFFFKQKRLRRKYPYSRLLVHFGAMEEMNETVKEEIRHRQEASKD
jgi:hypothetical protein